MEGIHSVVSQNLVSRTLLLLVGETRGHGRLGCSPNDAWHREAAYNAYLVLRYWVDATINT